MRNLVFIILVIFCLQSSASELSDIAEAIRSCQEKENLSEQTCATIVSRFLDRDKDEVNVYSTIHAGSLNCEPEKLDASASISAIANISQIQNLCKYATNRIRRSGSFIYFSINGKCMKSSENYFFYHGNYQSTLSSCSQKITEALGGF